MLFTYLLIIATQVNPTGTISLDFSGIETYKGYIQINVFNSVKGFPTTKELAIRSYQFKVEEGNTTFQIPDLKYGEYAISCYHDKNINGKLDTNFLGIPKEKVGTSNNTSNSYIPNYKDAKFILNKSIQKLSIQLK